VYAQQGRADPSKGVYEIDDDRGDGVRTGQNQEEFQVLLYFVQCCAVVYTCPSQILCSFWVLFVYFLSVLIVMPLKLAAHSHQKGHECASQQRHGRSRALLFH
jgi:hypothetical protein